ncbi:hypothetical protein BS17DRAFT_790057 [Gyrodon lividus]|nr:hypothetical protein BS17DRAFT_790057 [Gyrodon lividus]
MCGASSLAFVHLVQSSSTETPGAFAHLSLHTHAPPLYQVWTPIPAPSKYLAASVIGDHDAALGT